MVLKTSYFFINNNIEVQQITLEHYVHSGLTNFFQHLTTQINYSIGTTFCYNCYGFDKQFSNFGCN